MIVDMCDIPYGWTCGFPRPIFDTDKASPEAMRDYFRRHGVVEEPLHLRYFHSEINVTDLKENYRIAIPGFVYEILAVLNQCGHQAYAVGGAVRDSFLNRPIKDWDVSTSATPQQVTNIFENLMVPVHPTGIAHGTVTVVFGGENIEVTTFRTDVNTDGRHAEVAFSDNIVEDAYRRDLTINALYADRDGRVFDPTTEGLYDLMNQKIRMVGSPRDRINEDTLRILRAVRFAGQLDFQIEAHTAYVIHNCEADVLRNLSLERIISELERIRPSHVKVIAKFLAPVFGVQHLHLPYEEHILEELSKMPWFYLYIFAKVPGQWFTANPVISKDVKRAVKLLLNMSYGVPMDSWDAAQRFGLEEIRLVQKFYLLKHPSGEVPKMPFFHTLPVALVKNPVGSADFIEEFKGPELGKILDIANTLHAEFRFSLNKEELSKLARIKYNHFYG